MRWSLPGVLVCSSLAALLLPTVAAAHQRVRRRGAHAAAEVEQDADRSRKGLAEALDRGWGGLQAALGVRHAAAPRRARGQEHRLAAQRYRPFHPRPARTGGADAV